MTTDFTCLFAIILISAVGSSDVRIDINQRIFRVIRLSLLIFSSATTFSIFDFGSFTDWLSFIAWNGMLIGPYVYPGLPELSFFLPFT
jgi:hypothetical protein